MLVSGVTAVRRVLIKPDSVDVGCVSIASINSHLRAFRSSVERLASRG